MEINEILQFIIIICIFVYFATQKVNNWRDPLKLEEPLTKFYIY